MRSHPKYHAPDIYGTITGEAFVPVPSSSSGGGGGGGAEKVKTTLKDGGMDWSGTGSKIVGKGKEQAKNPIKSLGVVVEEKKVSRFRVHLYLRSLLRLVRCSMGGLEN